MHSLRVSVRRYGHLAFAMLILALCIKAAIPAGYMISPSADKLFEVSICSGTTGERETMMMAMPTKQEPGEQQHGKSKGEMPCAFSALAHHATGGASPELLVAALAVIVMLGLAPLARLTTPARRGDRPPLRGPPLTI